jgi:hypothetical protein
MFNNLLKRLTISTGSLVINNFKRVLSVNFRIFQPRNWHIPTLRTFINKLQSSLLLFACIGKNNLGLAWQLPPPFSNTLCNINAEVLPPEKLMQVCSVIS